MDLVEKRPRRWIFVLSLMAFLAALALLSTANAYVANGAVIAARFGDPERDEAARQALAKAFSRREIVMLRIDNIANGGGGVHCLTQPVPKTVAV